MLVDRPRLARRSWGAWGRWGRLDIAGPVVVSIAVVYCDIGRLGMHDLSAGMLGGFDGLVPGVGFGLASCQPALRSLGGSSRPTAVTYRCSPLPGREALSPCGSRGQRDHPVRATGSRRQGARCDS